MYLFSSSALLGINFEEILLLASWSGLAAMVESALALTAACSAAFSSMATEKIYPRELSGRLGRR